MTRQKPRPRSCIPSIAAHTAGTATDRALATTAGRIAGTAGNINAGRRRAGGAVITITGPGSTGAGCVWKSPCAIATAGGGSATE